MGKHCRTADVGDSHEAYGFITT